MPIRSGDDDDSAWQHGACSNDAAVGRDLRCHRRKRLLRRLALSSALQTLRESLAQLLAQIARNCITRSHALSAGISVPFLLPPLQSAKTPLSALAGSSLGRITRKLAHLHSQACTLQNSHQDLLWLKQTQHLVPDKLHQHRLHNHLPSLHHSCVRLWQTHGHCCSPTAVRYCTTGSAPATYYHSQQQLGSSYCNWRLSFKHSWASGRMKRALTISAGWIMVSCTIHRVSCTSTESTVMPSVHR